MDIFGFFDVIINKVGYLSLISGSFLIGNFYLN